MLSRRKRLIREVVGAQFRHVQLHPDRSKLCDLRVIGSSRELFGLCSLQLPYLIRRIRISNQGSLVVPAGLLKSAKLAKPKIKL